MIIILISLVAVVAAVFVYVWRIHTRKASLKSQAALLTSRNTVLGLIQRHDDDLDKLEKLQGEVGRFVIDLAEAEAEADKWRSMSDDHADRGVELRVELAAAKQREKEWQERWCRENENLDAVS